MEEKRCILCNKPYNYKYSMFGRGCLDNLYELLDIKKPSRFILIGKEPEDLTIEDKITDNLLIKSTVFNETIKSLIEKYGKETGKFDLKDYERNGVLLKFEGGDLLYSLHNATMFVNAIKNENSTWKLDGNIIDTYDFTEFKDLKEYVDKKESMLTDIFSTLLNNFRVVSSEYGVIKKYNINIKFNFSNYEIK